MEPGLIYFAPKQKKLKMKIVFFRSLYSLQYSAILLKVKCVTKSL